MKQSRNTSQRQLVRDLLEGNFSHPTADEIYELARKANPSISRGTVYRNLNLLADSGEISSVKYAHRSRPLRQPYTPPLSFFMPLLRPCD